MGLTLRQTKNQGNTTNNTAGIFQYTIAMKINCSSRRHKVLMFERSIKLHKNVIKQVTNRTQCVNIIKRLFGICTLDITSKKTTMSLCRHRLLSFNNQSFV